MFLKLWHDPVWSKVIAGVILAAGAVAVSYFLNWWSTIGELALLSYAFAGALTSVPNWLLVFLGLLALPSVIFLGAIVWQRAFPPQSIAPSWQSYTTDLFFGLRWRWKFGDHGYIYDAHTFCPHCDFQVYPRDVSGHRFIDHIEFHCDSCGRFLCEFQESFDLLENKTKRFIQQKIRNGTWSTQNSV